MKIRNGFVSNSSSSSFIVAFKISPPCSCCGRKDPDIVSMIADSSVYNDDNQVYATNTKDTIEYLSDDEYMDAEGKEKLLKDIAQYQKEDWNVAYFSMSNHDEKLREILKSMIANGNAVNLQSECD